MLHTLTSIESHNVNTWTLLMCTFILKELKRLKLKITHVCHKMISLYGHVNPVNKMMKILSGHTNIEPSPNFPSDKEIFLQLSAI
jgi:hypothetical protein